MEPHLTVVWKTMERKDEQHFTHYVLFTSAVMVITALYCLGIVSEVVCIMKEVNFESFRVKKMKICVFIGRH